MSCLITDAGVAGLAIDEGRAELLEEILTLAPVETTESRPGHRHRRVLPVLAAAAVVAVVGGVAWLGVQRGDDVRPAPAADPAASGELAVMDGHGWEVTAVTDHPAGGELTYEFDRDGRTLEITWRQAVLYESAVAAQDRTGTSVEVEVLGGGR